MEKSAQTPSGVSGRQFLHVNRKTHHFFHQRSKVHHLVPAEDLRNRRRFRKTRRRRLSVLRRRPRRRRRRRGSSGGRRTGIVLHVVLGDLPEDRQLLRSAVEQVIVDGTGTGSGDGRRRRKKTVVIELRREDVVRERPVSLRHRGPSSRHRGRHGRCRPRLNEPGAAGVDCRFRFRLLRLRQKRRIGR